MTINEILKYIDLPALIAEFFPESGAIAGKAGTYLAVWRGEKNPSLNLFKPTEVWFFKDHATGQSGTALHFFRDIMGWSHDKAMLELEKRAGVPKKKEIVATYNYTDENGKLLFQSVRYEPKSFSLRTWVDGKWEWGMGGVERVLFNLQEVSKGIAEGKLIGLVEGEKDALTLKKHGFIGTTPPMGAGKWLAGYTESLTGAILAIFPDNDKAGLQHVYKVALKIYKVTKQVKIVILPGLKDKQDITDWFEQGHTAEELNELIKNTEPFKPEDAEVVLDNLQAKEKEIGKKEHPVRTAIRLLEDTEFFHSPDGNSYASISVNGHLETYQLNQAGFKQYVTKTVYKESKNVLQNHNFNDLLNLLDAKAKFDGKEQQVFHRVARHGDNIYFNLCNDQWEIVEITSEGWEIINAKDCPVKFTRPKGTGTLPTPEKGGAVDMLRAFIHVPDEEWLLLSAFLIGCLKPEGPYPILNLVAEQGSGKSTTAKILKWLVDPTSTNGRLLRLSPRDEQSIFIGARNNHILAFDNLSGVRSWLSDALCVLSTGGSFVTRALYTDSEETVLEAMRPVILTGIGDLATRGDLLSRSLVVSLPRLTGREVVNSKILWQSLEVLRPKILGGLLDAVSLSLRNESAFEQVGETRLADFECWVSACESALGVEDTSFATAYKHSRQTSVEVVLSNSPLPPQIKVLLERCYGVWQGTSSELLADLEEFASDRTLRQYGWPKNPNQLGKEIDRLAPALREMDVNIERHRSTDKARVRVIEIKSI